MDAKSLLEQCKYLIYIQGDLSEHMVEKIVLVLILLSVQHTFGHCLLIELDFGVFLGRPTG